MDSAGYIRFSNGLLETELGRPPDWLVGRQLDEVVDDRSRPELAEILKAAAGAVPAFF